METSGGYPEEQPERSPGGDDPREKDSPSREYVRIERRGSPDFAPMAVMSSSGWPFKGPLLTCPRHRWQFALEDGGRCVTAEASVHAVRCDPDQ